MFFHLLYLRAKKGIKRKTLFIFLLCAITCLASMKGQFLWKPSFEAFEAFEAFLLPLLLLNTFAAAAFYL
jgi:hypothetical protein